VTSLAPSFPASAAPAELAGRPWAADAVSIARACLWVLIGLAAAVAVTVTALIPFGGRALTVMSGSMSPAIETGDVVVSRSVSPLDLRLGDVVTFRDPHDSKRLITHRVRGIRISGGEARFVTKGDANNSAESWVVPSDGKVGLVAFRLPKLGYLFSWLGNPLARLALVVVPALLLGAFELRRIWGHAEEANDAPAT
jgi:signal peptidase